MGERRDAYGALVGKLERSRPLGRPRRRWEDNITVKCIFERLDGGHRLDGSDSGQGQVGGCCESGNEPSGSIKCGESLEYLRTSLASQEGLCSMELVSYNIQRVLSQDIAWLVLLNPSGQYMYHQV